MEHMTRVFVADSFRVSVREGRAGARAFELHLDRFARSVREASGGTLMNIDGFLRGARARISEFGEGFPRLEYRGGGDDGLHLELRELPQLGDSIEMRSMRLDTLTPPLEHPERKGPNIGLLGALKRQLGAEALLIDDAGNITEGATTSVVWWRGAVLHTVASTARVTSVTESLVTSIAGRMNMTHLPSNVSAEQLAGCEVWALNALHGIRPVIRIDEHALSGNIDMTRLEVFRTALEEAWQPVLRE